MLAYLTLILLCQLAGEVTASITNAPVPGPVIGMLLLFVYLCIKGHVPETLNTVSSALLNNLSLMFVPAGVGVMVHVQLLGDDAVALSAAVIGSTVLTIAVTAVTMIKIQQWLSRTNDADTPHE